MQPQIGLVADLLREEAMAWLEHALYLMWIIAGVAIDDQIKLVISK